MQTTFQSSRILLPVRPWFVYLTLAVALCLNFLPTSRWIGVPDWVAFVLCFWGVRESRRVGMGWAFILGLLMDVADGSILGQHVLAYVPLAFIAMFKSRRILWFPLGLQALHVLPLFCLVPLVQTGLRMMTGAEFPGVTYFISPFVSASLWTPLTLLLLLPQYQPVEHDETRPING